MHARAGDGSLLYAGGSIAIHCFSMPFVKRLAAEGFALPYHRARKKVPYVDESGARVEPEAPNATKFEMFVFDALLFAERVVAVETAREEEFSPVKNAEGADSPATARRDLSRLYATWLMEAGVGVPFDENGYPTHAIEISPLYAEGAEELARRYNGPREISGPTVLEVATHDPPPRRPLCNPFEGVQEMPSADMKEHQVRYDYTNMLSDAVGKHGVSKKELDDLAKRYDELFALLKKQRAEGTLGFMDLPYDETAAGNAMKTASALKGRFDNLVVLGIGGSALGTIALKSALGHPIHNMLDEKGRGGRPRLFVLDNIDPDLVAAVAEYIDPKRTLFNVVTKSGSTAETMSQLVLFHEMLEKALGRETADHVVATTDPEKGDLRKMVGDFGWRSLPIPPNVGGRFSVMTSVGLFPAAMLGIDVRQLLSGAAFMDRRCESHSPEENPALAYAALQYILDGKGVNISIVMPYSSALFDVADWYRQLWAESLGKKTSLAGEVVNVGPNARQVPRRHRPALPGTALCRGAVRQERHVHRG